ncbi:MAG: hypothetical protein ING22_03520 [Burkholderiales bacterium]|nr:hypothetical protein [Burkholderiales bacterium]
MSLTQRAGTSTIPPENPAEIHRLSSGAIMLPIRNTRSRRSGEKLSIKNIYVGSLDTTMEIDVGGPPSLSQFVGSYYIKNQKDLDNFISGRKFYVYGQKGAGKTAFLRYAGEMVRRNKDLAGTYILYRFAKDFPDQAHRDITEYVYRKRKKEHDSDNTYINIFRDLDYEDFWTYIILDRVNDFLSSASEAYVLKDKFFERFQKKLKDIDKGTIMDRIARLVPRAKQGTFTIAKEPSLSTNFEWGEGSDHFNKFSEYVSSLKEAFTDLNWSTGYVNFMFDEIDPRVGSGKSFQLDCILIRDLIVTIYNLNNLASRGERRIVFSAAIRSEVLQSVERLGKEIHKILGQLGIHMTWGEYGRLDINHPLIKMICRKIHFSEMANGISFDDGEDPSNWIWKKYFRKNKNDELSPKYLLEKTWLKPRDIVRILQTCQEIDGNSRMFSESLIARSGMRYANDSWKDIVSQLTSFISPDSIDALDTIFSGYREKFTLTDVENQITLMAGLSGYTKQLREEIGSGDLLKQLYIHGVIVCQDGSRFRAYFKGHEVMNINSVFQLHPALLARFSTADEPSHSSDQFDLEL